MHMHGPTASHASTSHLHPHIVTAMSHAKHLPFEDVQAARPLFDALSDVLTTKTPNPEFKPGQGMNALPGAQRYREGVKYKEVNPDDCEDKSVLYKMMISAVLAPMSYFNICGHNPPTLMISISATGQDQRSSGYKDTGKNIKDNKEFCVSIISEHFVEAANFTSIDAPSEVDEWALSGLTKRASLAVQPPHVAESAFSMECVLQHHYDMTSDDGKRTGTVILGRIKRFHIMEHVLDPNDPGIKLMIEKLRPVSRLGGISYGRTTEVFEIPRPVWEKVKGSPEVESALRGAK